MGKTSDMREEYIQIYNLKISKKILEFVNNELLIGTEVSPDNFWKGFDDVVHELAPINKELIKTRDKLQKKIDDWYIQNKGN